MACLEGSAHKANGGGIPGCFRREAGTDFAGTSSFYFPRECDALSVGERYTAAAVIGGGTGREEHHVEAPRGGAVKKVL